MKHNTDHIRRNSVVMTNDSSVFYARVWKILPDDRALIINCGLHLINISIFDLVWTDYKGRWTSNRSILEKTHFLGMSRLRNLIKGAKIYNPDLIPNFYEDTL